MEDLEDTHLCLKCNAKIIGLDKYVAHRKQNCFTVKTISVPKLSSEKQISNGETQINDFFTSLELQSTCTLPRSKTSPEDIEGLHQFSDDEYVPPRTHTGGKWAPGTRPELTNEQLQSITPFTWSMTSSCKQEGDDECDTVGNENVNSPKVVRNKVSAPVVLNLGCPTNSSSHEDKISSEQPDQFERNDDVITGNCSKCNKIFQCKKDYAIHQFSLEHKEKLRDSNEWLKEIARFQISLMNLFPYHCHVCRCYYLYHKELNRHVKTWDHIKKVYGKLHYCLPCHYECRAGADMANHFASEGHKGAEKQILENHPVIVVTRSKFSKYGCSFCPERQCIFNKLKEKKNAGVFKCAECEMCFEKNFQHDEHFLIEHRDCRCCKPCNRVFESASVLLRSWQQ